MRVKDLSAVIQRFIFVFSLALTLLVAQTSSAIGGDLLHGNGNGDCWRSGTPYVCRVGWAGANTYFTVYMVDQIGSPPGAYELRYAAQQAASNWSVAPGPQSLSWNATWANTWMYVRIEYTGGYGTASTRNYRSDGYIMGFADTGAIWYSLIKVDPSNWTWDIPRRTSIFAHEFGHGLGLGHHTNENAGVMWPYTASAIYSAPTGFDIGPNPPCSGATNSYLGIRCIYNFGL